MIYRNKESGCRIQVIDTIGYGTVFETLDDEDNVTGTGTMSTYILDTEFEVVDNNES